MINETLGSYRILSQLGAGAMGEVYLAEHRHLKRKAAVKLLGRELIGRPDLLERFFLEARATSAIAHPGIVQIFDCEIDATGRPYIVMEYLSGETLAARLTRSRPLPPLVAARLVQSMASALGAAHAKGIVHRDVKPENVFVDPGPPESVKLVDFGIAKLAGDFQGEQVHRTRIGSLMGTPLYMSPEQCRDSAGIDFRTDLYSLGCVMFEMLTGRPPFTHQALGDLVVAHLTEAPVDVSTLNASVPATLADICAALLQKNPGARPASMADVVERMGSFIARATTIPSGPPIVAAPEPPVGTARADARVKTTFGEATGELVPSSVEAAGDGEGDGPPRRGRTVVGVGIAVVVLIGGGVALRTSMSTQASDPSVAPTEPAGVVNRVASGSAGVATKKTASLTAVPVPRSETGRRGEGAGTSADKSSRRASGKGDTASKFETKGKARPTDKNQPHDRNEDSASSDSAAKVGSPLVPVAVGVSSPATPAPARGATSAETSKAPGRELIGTWEGPWNDPGKQQKGRLYLQLSADGSASGWMFNAAAGQSFRLVGRLSGGAVVDLVCQCPPERTFSVHGTIASNDEGVVTGKLTLSSGAGTFGQSHVTLRRAAAR